MQKIMLVSSACYLSFILSFSALAVEETSSAPPPPEPATSAPAEPEERSFSSWLKEGKDLTLEKLDNAKESVVTGTENLKNRTEEGVKNAWENSKNKTTEAWESSKEKTNEAWQNSKEGVTNLWQNSQEKVTGLLEKDSAEKSVLAAEDKHSRFAAIWQEVTPRLEKALDLSDRHADLPDKSYFKEDKRENQSKIDILLDEAVAILGVSPTQKTRDQIRQHEAEIRGIKDQIGQYRQEQVAAPVQSKWKTTVADYDDKIAQLKTDIAQHDLRINELKQEFAKGLSDMGLYLNQEQVDLLFASVVGDDIIQSSVVYAHVKQMSEQLMQLTIKTQEDLAVSRRYYGLYTILLKVLLHMQNTFINNIDGVYLPKIEGIQRDVRELQVSTQKLMREQSDKSSVQHLQANTKAQELTLKTARLYQQHLLQQKQKITVSRQKTEANLRVAQNTYNTVTVSGELVNLLRTSQKAFDILLNIQTPDLLIFQNLQMKQEFASLTTQISK